MVLRLVGSCNAVRCLFPQISFLLSCFNTDLQKKKKKAAYSVSFCISGELVLISPVAVGPE